MGLCVSRDKDIDNVQAKCGEIDKSLLAYQRQVETNMHTIEAYFHNLRMGSTKDLMKQINKSFEGGQIYVTPEVRGAVVQAVIIGVNDF